MSCRFGSLIACDNFHADVHAGNLWLLRDGRIGFLDFGMLLFGLAQISVLNYLDNLRIYIFSTI